MGDALEVLAEGLAPFVDRRMSAHFTEEDWIVVAATRLGRREPVLASPTDPQFQLEVMVRWWGPVFAPALSKDTRDTVQELRRARNDWAHIDDTHPIDYEYARRIHALAEDLLEEIGSPLTDRMRDLLESLERESIRAQAAEQGVGEEEVLLLRLSHLQSEREELSGQLADAQAQAASATGRQRAVARQLAELQAQYAAVSGLRERYRQLQSELDEARRTGEQRADDVTAISGQLSATEQALGQLQEQAAHLHQELRATREALHHLDPVDTEIGRRWIWLVATLILVLGVAIILAFVEGASS